MEVRGTITEINVSGRMCRKRIGPVIQTMITQVTQTQHCFK
jgi:hypothetical protein